MLANFIFHFIFTIFAVWAGVAWFILNNRYRALRENLVPTLCLKNLNMTDNRSLLIRALRTLEEELTISYKIKFSIDINSFKEEKNPQRLLLSLSSLLIPKSLKSEIQYEFNNKTMNAKEFTQNILADNKIKKLYISYLNKTDNENNYVWKVERVND
ncbi:hypothetical protein [Fluviispira vulneris]|uniref:hypothetical protein n=1 Tax=Fluviispira vulneris TaxID=2763012 RepID=UPI0016474719|nr:hypothetical protein [Fluviispira vulneris]